MVVCTQLCKSLGTFVHDAGLSRVDAQPARKLGAPLHYHRHLLPGYESLPRSTRERWRRLDAGDGLTLAELAWYACDGRRSPDEIAHLIWLETGRRDREFVERFFALASELDLVAREPTEAAWNTRARGTGSR